MKEVNRAQQSAHDDRLYDALLSLLKTHRLKHSAWKNLLTGSTNKWATGGQSSKLGLLVYPLLPAGITRGGKSWEY